jgi:hypothetical protein
VKGMLAADRRNVRELSLSHWPRLGRGVLQYRRCRHWLLYAVGRVDRGAFIQRWDCPTTPEISGCANSERTRDQPTKVILATQRPPQKLAGYTKTRLPLLSPGIAHPLSARNRKGKPDSPSGSLGHYSDCCCAPTCLRLDAKI